MSKWTALRAVFAALLTLATGTAFAQATFSTYADTDNDPTTGCTVTLPGGTFQGAELRVQVTATTGGAPAVTGVAQANCAAGVFGANTTIGGGSPVGLNLGTSGADVVEFAVPLTSFFGPGGGTARVGFAGENAGGSDVMFTSTGAQGGSPMLLGSAPLAIPLFGIGGMALLAAVLMVVGMRASRARLRRVMQMSAVSLLLVCGVALAANFVVDGQIGDWAGETVRGNDPAADSTNASAAIDLRAAYYGVEGARAFFRLDVTDMQNQPPVVPDITATVNEDGTVTLNLAGTDPEGQPLTFAIATPPTNGALGAVTQVPPTSATVVYTPNANYFGPDSFTFTATDGQATSAPATATITVVSINDAPSFTGGAAQTVLEDAGAQTVTGFATAISVGPANESAQSFTFEITNNTNAALFSTAPAISPTGTLTYTPAANANGTATITYQLRDNGGTANGGIDVSPTQTVVITVTAVNDAPGFTVGANQTVLEDAGAQTVANWATAISAGPADEAAQTLTFNITNNTNAALFSVAPAVSATGTLTYTPAANAAGTATITLALQDNGGTANGGVDTSPTQTFTITVTGINDAPSFTGGPAQTTNEDAGAQTVAGFATAISAGPPDEAAQTLTFEITNNTNPALFSAAPAISAAGTLTYTAAANANGTSTITYRLRDNGGTANGGIDVSPTQTVVITINAVNDAPSFTVGANQTSNEDAGAQTVVGWATAISPGPADEAAQTLTFNVTGNTNTALFSAAPTVSPTGTLTYTAAANQSGFATITLALQDNGGTANGGIDTSATQTFTITVNGTNDPPVNTVPGAQATADTTALVFSTGNGNAISVADPDAGVSNIQTALTIGSGTLTLPSTVGVTAVGNGTGNLQITGPQAAINTVLNGLIYQPQVGTSATLTLTVATSDLGNTGAGGPLTDTDLIAINVDAAPTVLSVTPANGAAGVAANANIVVTFSEPVTPTGSWFALTCGLSGTRSTANSVVTGGPTVFTINPNVDFSSTGEACGLGIVAAQITDNDVIDPPDAMAANFNSAFTTDAAPTVTSTTPANGAANVAANVPLTINFSENVNVTAGGVTLACNAFPVALAGLPATNVNSISLTHADLTPGALCNVTVVAASVTDVDASDPPDNLAADFAWTFTVDAAPAVTTVSPANGATQVATTAPLTINFSENVDLTGTAVTLNCGGAIALTGLPATNTNSVTLTHAALPTATACTATVVAAQTSDTDANDPPNNLVSDFVWTFTTDAAPAVTGTTPANAATGVSPTANLVVTFSEPVNFTLADFSLTCNSTAQTFTVAGTTTATATLTPSGAGLTPGANCVLTVLGAAISDVDAGDPPDVVGANTTVNFVTAAVANDDTYAATPHLTLGINGAVQGGGVLVNDLIGAAVITGYGAGPAPGTCNTQVTGTPGATALGGRIVLASDGSFTYFPPPTSRGVADSFCYTITGGDTATVTFNIANTALVWFVDTTYAGANGAANGTQGRPFAQLVGAGGFEPTAADGVGDFIFVADGNYTCGLTLLSGQSLIGDGATGTLNARTAITPVAGSAFAAFSGTDPVLTSGAGIDCVTLSANAGTKTVVGLTIGDSGGAAGNASDIAGTNFGTAQIGDITLNGTGRALNLSNGALGMVDSGINDLDVTAGTNAGVTLNAVSGTLTVGGASSIAGVAGVGVDIQAGSVTTTFANLTVNKAAAGAAVNLVNLTGTQTFNALSLTTAAGPGLVTNTVTTLAINGVTNTISATGGAAMDMTSTDTAINVFTASSTNSATTGLSLTNLTGSTVVLGGAISGATGTAVNALGTLGTTTYAGSITKANAGKAVVVGAGASGTLTLGGAITCNSACTGIDVVNRTGGTINFSGASKVVNTGANPAVTITGNTTATQVNFTSGGLDIDTTSGTGYNATGAGTLTVTGTGNSITSGTGTALNVGTGVTFGAGGLTFQSIAANGAANAINLTGVLGTGALSVTGTGAVAGTGGTLQNLTGSGLNVTTAPAINLSNMVITATGSHGIAATGYASTLTLTNTQITNAGNGDNEHGINWSNGAGTLTLSGTTISNPAENGVNIDNNAGTMNFNMSSASAISFPASLGAFSGNGILATMHNAAAMNVNIANSTFTNVPLNAINLGGDATSSGTQSYTVTNNTFSTTITGRANNLNAQFRNTQVITAADFLSNTFTGVGGGPINIGGDESSLADTVHANNNNISNSPSVGLVAGNDNNSQMRIETDSNTINNVAADGIEISNFGGTGTSETDTQVTNNIITNHSQNTAVAFVGGIALFSFEESTCNKVLNNNVSGTPTPGVYFDYYLQELGGTMVHEEVPNGAGTSLSQAFISATNTGAAGAAGVFADGAIDLSNGVTCDPAL